MMGAPYTGAQLYLYTNGARLGLSMSSAGLYPKPCAHLEAAFLLLRLLLQGGLLLSVRRQLRLNLGGCHVRLPNLRLEGVQLLLPAPLQGTAASSWWGGSGGPE